MAASKVVTMAEKMVEWKAESLAAYSASYLAEKTAACSELLMVAQ